MNTESIQKVYRYYTENILKSLGKKWGESVNDEVDKVFSIQFREYIMPK